MAIDGGSVEIRFEGDVAPLRRSVEEAVESLEDVSKAAEDVDKQLASSGFDGFGKKAKQEFQEFSDSATDAFTRAIDGSDSLISSLGNIGSALKNIGFGVLTAGATAATKSLIKMTKAGVQDAQALENTQIQMIGLTDSVEAGNKAMSMAIKYFKNNPFNRFDVTSATKNLIQFGAELDNIPDLLDKLGKVSLSTGAGINDLAYYYQRTISDGRIATRDLLQMQNQGVPIFGALAKQIGVTTGAVRELAAKGKISIEDFQAAFDNLVSDEAMERFNNTLSRQIDRFKGRLSDMRGALAGYTMDESTGEFLINENGIYRSYTKLLKKLADLMTSSGDNANPVGIKLVEGFEKLSDAIGKIIDKVTDLAEPVLNAFGNVLNFIGDNSELVIPLLGGLAVALGKIGSHLPVIGDLIKGVTNNFGKLSSGIKGLVSSHPLLSAMIALFTVGFADAMKTDEEFRKTIQDLGAALKDIISTLMDAGRGVFSALVDVMKEIASSGAVKGILQAVATALKGIAQAIASIPPEMIAGLLSFILSLKMLNASPILYAVTLIGMFITYVKEMGSLPEALKTIGHNMMTGLFNGLKEGATKVFNFVKQVASTVIETFKNMWGIHSPSTVGYDLGYNWGLGIAGGVSDSSNAVQVAMDNLASDVLKTAEKVLSNKVSFGLLDYKGEYQEWKKISKLFVEGSEQYNSAIEKMEEARKNANLKILELQKSYNEQLDSTISKIGSMYGLFSDVNLGGGKDSSKILKNLDQQVAKLQEWAEAQKIINSLGLDPKLVEELQEMGVDSVSELSAIANMTASELSTLNDLWLEKQSIANEAGIRQMEGLKNDTLEQINDLKNGIDGATIDVADIGGRLVENISEGVYGAMPTLESAFAQLDKYIADAQRKLGEGVSGYGTSDTDGPSVPDAGTIKEEIQASMDKLKSMLPNILLGAIGAWGAFKFGPKVLKALGNKLFGKGGGVAESLSGTLFRLAEGGKLGKLDLQGVVDALFANSTEGSNSQKIISAIQDKLNNLGSSGAVQEAAKNVSKVSKPAESIAQGTQNVSKSLETTSQSMSKASKWMNSIQQGAKTIIYIAGAIAAMAGALWLAYNALKDIDFGKFQLVIVEMTEAIVVFGGLAKVADMLKIGVGGILAIAGIAADVALVGLACKIAYDSMKDINFMAFQGIVLEMIEAIAVIGGFSAILGILMPEEALGLLAIAGIAADTVLLGKAIKEAYDTMEPIKFDKFQEVILEMIEALGVMGGFSAVFGLLAPLEFLGWASIRMICDELVQTSEALYKVYIKVPDDFDGVKDKIDLIKVVLNKIADTDLGTLIGTIVTSWEVGPLLRIVDMYVQVAEQLNKLSKIELDGNAIDSNLNYIKTVLESIKAKSDIITSWLEASALDMEASTVENAGRIVIVYGDMVDALDKLANFSPDEKGITKSLLAMVGVITLLRNQSYGSGGIFNIFRNMKTVANDVEKIKSIVKDYLEMVPTFQDLGKSENQISEELKTTVQDNIKRIKDIVLEIGSVDTGGWVDQKESDVGKIQSILKKFTELIPVANQIAGMNIAKGDENSGAIKRIKQIKDIVFEIGSVDTAGWIDQKESDVGKIQSILNKFVELIPVINQVSVTNIAKGDENSGAIQRIKQIKDIVLEIGGIDTSQLGDMPAKESMVESATSLANKLATFSATLNSIENPVQQDIATGLVATVNTLITGLSAKLNDEVVVFNNIGVKISDNLRNGIQSRNASLTQTGIGVQAAIWAGIQSNMQNWYNQGRILGERFRQGFYDVSYSSAGSWAVQGFINGALSRANGTNGIYNTGWWVANRFLQGLKDRGEQGSPWKTTFESGQFAMEGLIEGLRSSESTLVGEASSIADQVVEALTMDSLTMSPSLNAGINSVAPNMVEGEYGMISGNGGVVVNQNVTAYTEYDIEQTSRDLAWSLSTI